MSNQYVELPVPLGNGVGAAVDMTTFGGQKTIVVTGSSKAQINIEINNADDNTSGWAPLVTIQNAGMLTTTVACKWMRVRVSGYNSSVGGTSFVNVGGNDAGAVFVELPVPAGNGAGAAVDVSAIVGTFKTAQIGGPFQGSLIVELSVDGTDQWAQPFAFNAPGQQSLSFIAKFMRVRRVGVPVIAPGSPVCNVGFVTEGGGGGGGSLPPDGDYGDVTVSNDGLTWDVNELPQSRITDLVGDLATLSAAVAASVPESRVVNATAPLTVNGGASADLSADITLAVDTGGLVPATRSMTAVLPLEINGSNAPQDLTADQTYTINDFTTTNRGVVIAGGAPSNVLRGNNTWSTIAQMTAALDLFTTTLQGLTSPSGAAANFLRGNNTWSTIAQVTAALDLFTTSLRGLVSPSAAAANFLRGDNSWSTPTQVTAALDLFTTVLRGLVSPSSANSNFLRGDNTWSTIAQVTAALDPFSTTLQGLTSASGAAANFLRGNNTWSTVAQVTAALNAFTTTLQGLVSASGAAANFLRGDNTWSTPAQVTAALGAFTTLLQGLVSPSGAAANFLRGDNTWSTVAQVTAALNVFTSVLQGLVPASGGGTTNFLRADGTWAAVSVPAFDTVLNPTQITFGSAFDNWNPGTFGQNTLVRCTTDGSTRSVRGMVGGVNGITVSLLNVNASSGVGESWVTEDGAATAANRFRSGFTSGCAVYYYDSGLSRWCILSTGS